MLGDKPVGRKNKLPFQVKRVLYIIGSDVRNARRRRRIPSALLAERAGISRTTLVKIEKGDPGVSFGIYASVLFVLGMLDRLTSVTDVKNDDIGLMLEEEQLPERVRQVAYKA